MKEVLISSINKPDSNSFHIEIPYCSEIRLVEASIPGSFSNVTTSQFTIVGSVSGATVIPIVGGRYTLPDLISYMGTQIGLSIGGQTYSVVAGKRNNIIISSTTETFAVTGGTAATYIGFINTAVASYHEGTSVFYSLYPSHMFIKIDKIFGIDNGTISSGESGILHAVPLCTGSVTNYRSDGDAPWVKLINLFGVTTSTITMQVSLKLSTGAAVDLGGDNWAMKIYIRL
jgi:hypothetical protein